MKVHQLIKHLQKYPSHLDVSVYKPPVSGGMKIMAPNFKDPQYEGEVLNRWLYNTRRLYIPIHPYKKMQSNAHLPEDYVLPRKPVGKGRSRWGTSLKKKKLLGLKRGGR